MVDLDEEKIIASAKTLREIVLKDRDINPSNRKTRADEIDTNIIQLLTSGKSSKEISSTVNVPRSTIHRRIRNLITSGLIS